MFNIKNVDKKLLKYKARLVVKGFGQKQGINFDEIFSSVVKMCSIRVILGLATSMNLELEQFDVKTAFLHGDLMKRSLWSNQKLQSEREGEHGLQVKEKSIWT